ncbi:MAG TPA: amino acid ABC transporter permease [Bacillota bacterium]|jgi:putative glutamine transport system permease protein
MTLKGFADLFRPENIRFLGYGLATTLEMAILTILMSFVFGLGLAIARYSGDRYRHTRWGRGIGLAAFIYIEAIRNLPMLLIMLGTYLLTKQPALRSAVIGMTVFTSAVMAEIIRGGLISIDRGQWEAATAQGFSYQLILQHIVLPQALRRMIPPIVSQFITVVKDTAFAWALGVEEITGKGTIIFAKYVNPLETFFTIAVVYFIVNYMMSQAARAIERKLAVRTF